MALAEGFSKYIGNEIIKVGKKDLANKPATSVLASVAPKASAKVRAKVANESRTATLGSLVPKKATSNSSPDMITIYRGLTQKYDPKYPVEKLDTSGYESWTDNPELARQYGDYVYSIDVPKADIKDSYLDENPNSLTYGDRNPIYKIDKKAGLNGVSGKEYLLEVGSDYQKGLTYNEVPSKVKMAKKNSGVSSDVLNGKDLKPVIHIPVEESSSLSSIIPVKRKLYRGQQYSNTDFSYNSELMNDNPDKWASKDVGKGYHFTPKKDMAGSWEGSDGGVIEVDYTPDQVLKADDARKMIEEANKLLADDKYMAKLWQENEAIAEQIEKIADGNLEALAKREGKPFVQHLKANDDELGTMYYYKDIDPELTDRFVSEFKKKAEKYIPNNNQQVDELVMPDAKLSPEQQEFFKDSVVRDESGGLIPMYHGSNSNFTIFDKSKGGQSNKSAKVGFWFTPNKEGAEKWAGQSWWGDNEPKVYETYLNIKKPFIYKEVDNSSQIAKLEEQLRIAEDEINSTYRGSREYYDAYKRYNNIAKQIEDLSYTDPYEQFRSHIYAMEGKSPSQANTGGVGMVMDNEDEAVKKYVEMLKSEGYDGIIIKGTNYDRNTMGSKNDQYVVFDPEQIKNVDNLNPTNNPDIRYSEVAMANGGILDDKTKRAIEIIDQANNFGQPVENALYNKIDPSTLPKGYSELEKLLDSGTSSDNVIAKRVAEKIGTDDPTNADLDKVLDYLYVGDNREKRVFKQSLEEKIKKFERDSKALGLDIDDPRDRMTKSEMYKLFGQVWDKAKKEEIDKIMQLSDGTDIMNALMDPGRRGIRTGTAGGLDTALSERLGIAPGNTIKISSDRYGDYGNPQSAGRYNRHYKDIAINSKGSSVESQVSTMAHERLHSFQNEARPENLGRYSKEVSDAYLELQKDLAPFLKDKEEIAKRYGKDKADYWASDIEQESRMFQNYLENTGITNNALSSIAKGEWGDEIKPAFDKFVKTLQRLSKEGKALPAIAGLFGIGALSANSNKEKS